MLLSCRSGRGTAGRERIWAFRIHQKGSSLSLDYIMVLTAPLLGSVPMILQDLRYQALITLIRANDQPHKCSPRTEGEREPLEEGDVLLS